MKEQGKASTNDHLSRGLRKRHVQLIALGGTIGTGLFLGSGSSIHSAGPSILIAYFITGVICFLLMRGLGELLLSDLNANSFIYFIQKYLGEKWGFVTGWTYWICWITIAMAEITASGLYMQFWFPHLPQWVTAVVMLAVLLLLNSVTVKAFGETEFWFSIIKIVAIMGLIIAGIIMVLIHFKTPVGYASVTNLFSHGFFAHGAKGFLLSFQMVMFSFVGIEMVGMTASETADPDQVLPEAINEIPMRIILFYVGSLMALMCIYPWMYISPNSSPFVQVFQSAGVRGAAAIINFVVLTAAASACNSSIFTTGRMLFSLTYQGKSRFSKRVGTLSRTQVPVHALRFSTLVIALAAVLNFIMPGKVFTLVASVATTAFLFIWGAIMVAHLKYRRSLTPEETAKLPFKMPWYPLSDYVVIGFMIFVAVILLFETSTLLALIGAVIWIGGLYFFKAGEERAAKNNHIEE
ncbi:amino acid permease [Levilactobacillus bambusae]|uniref:Amino acid permease n=1 Tax=Levilactobacillus bambusae TaxID=2024736 RepID=A0A2V1MXU5_9LACO|nr:amino acid permease [Levilactobacillus bambusae]PWF99612.1 amino acid permease [Levilactobacillus bambusae]